MSSNNNCSANSSSFSSPEVGVGLGIAAHGGKFLKAQELAKDFLKLLRFYAEYGNYPPLEEEEEEEEDPNTLGYYYNTLESDDEDRKKIDQLLELTQSQLFDWNYKTALEFTKRLWTNTEADLKIIKII